VISDGLFSELQEIDPHASWTLTIDIFIASCSFVLGRHVVFYSAAFRAWYDTKYILLNSFLHRWLELENLWPCWGRRASRSDESVRIVNTPEPPSLHILHKLPLTCFSRKVPADSITVSFGLKQWDEVNSGPRLFSGKFIQLVIPFYDVIEAISANDAHGEEVVSRLEATGWNVSFVLDRLVASGWREILYHGV